MLGWGFLKYFEIKTEGLRQDTARLKIQADLPTFFLDSSLGAQTGFESLSHVRNRKETDR